MSNTNPWKYVQLDEGELATNPYLNPPAKPVHPTPLPTPAPTPTNPVSLSNAGNSLLLENLVCVDADRNVLEQYPTLAIQKDIFRNAQSQQINFTPYQGAVHCEQNGLFLPSFALTCNILVALYQNRNIPEAKKLLDMYKDKGNGNGWHAQNTIINWGTKQIIHYPRDNDFPQHGGNNNINQSRPPIRLSFDRTGFADKTLADSLQTPNFKRYVQNLTGLQNPSVLVQLGEYFGKPAYVWPSSSNETRAAWLGCDDCYFLLNGNGSLYNYYAARGVRLVAP